MLPGKASHVNFQVFSSDWLIVIESWCTTKVEMFDLPQSHSRWTRLARRWPYFSPQSRSNLRALCLKPLIFKEVDRTAGFPFSLMSYGVALAAVPHCATSKLISLSVSGPHLQFIITAATLKIQGEPTMTLHSLICLWWTVTAAAVMSVRRRISCGDDCYLNVSRACL